MTNCHKREAKLSPGLLFTIKYRNFEKNTCPRTKFNTSYIYMVNMERQGGMLTRAFRWFPFLLVPLSLLYITSGYVRAIEIERFEHISTRNGLSQNSVLCMFCDHMGFLWFGTMNGLNRYDGYEFKIYKAQAGRSDVLSNNRIVEIWEDEKKFLWVRTYDGYIHCLNRSTDRFSTFPRYLDSTEDRISIITSFYQPCSNEVWIGSSNSGIYRLIYDSLANDYRSRQFLSRGVNPVTSNDIRFIWSSPEGDLLVGTRNGLNFLPSGERKKENPVFQHLLVDHEFTSVTFSQGVLWLGTRGRGMLQFDIRTLQIIGLPGLPAGLASEDINLLHAGRYGHIIIGTSGSGLHLYYPSTGEFHRHSLRGNLARSIYEDYLGNFWVATERLGIDRINPLSRISRHFDLTPPALQPLVDDERPYFYEDGSRNLWIGLHGAGLAMYDRAADGFRFYRNDPANPGSLSSNVVHCIAEDHSGLLWVGTGQFNGGINKVITVNPSFRHVLPVERPDDISQNVVRAVFRDSNGCIWVACKSGKIYIYNSDFSLNTVLHHLPLAKSILPGSNIYTITEDHEGHIWLGSKGGGVIVSTQTIHDIGRNYASLTFYSYQNDRSDEQSLSNDMVYSIQEDQHQRMWIGTYGGGLNLVTERTPARLVCRHIDRSNSNIGSNFIRQVFQDSRGQIWLATTFGLHLMEEEGPSDSTRFRIFNYNPLNETGISYNDVIHLFEDSKNRLWIGTFGGGVSLLSSLDADSGGFRVYNENSGLANDAVFGILEDADGYLWFSTESGLSRFDPSEGNFLNFNESNGLQSGNFNENTCFSLDNNLLLFGTMKGILFVNPGRISSTGYLPRVVLTRFQLFNEEVNIQDKNAPFKTTIETTRKIRLAHNQSSFSIEFAGLSYFDPGSNEYAFMLENFDPSWNFVANQRKATYTNLAPGNYIFHVKASGVKGEWSGEGTSLEIQIMPPWWQTGLARFMYVIAALILLDIARRIFTRYNRMRNDLRVEKKVNEIKLQFFTDISHEIRTPLTLMLGPIEDLKNETGLPEKVHSKVGIMERNGKRMLRLVNELLDFRKIQKDKINLKVQEISLVKFVEEVAIHFQPIIRQRKIDFHILGPGYDIPVFVDPKRFDSVIFNILSNAFKYTPVKGKVEMKIRTVNDGFAEIAVTDQGEGIPKDKIRLLFQRFATMSESPSFSGGSGIGLSLSIEIMKLHHGDIDVESEQGKGSTFTIRVKLGKEHFKPDEMAAEPANAQELHPASAKDDTLQYLPPSKPINHIPADPDLPCLLIVEDNPEIIDYLEESLGEEFNLISAENGKQGLEAVYKHQPDMVITDLLMPVMDGMEMTRIIKEDFEISHIPVIMLTAKSEMEDQIKGIHTGAEAYILKPFNTEYVRAVVRNILKQRELVVKKYRDKSVLQTEIKLTSRDEQFMNEVVKLIEENYTFPEFNVEKLVELTSLGRTVFYNKIKGLTGLTPVEFLRQMRLKIAANILQNPEISVSEAAYMAGFSDVKYFSRCFRKLFGVYPKEYKTAGE